MRSANSDGLKWIVLIVGVSNFLACRFFLMVPQFVELLKYLDRKRVMRTESKLSELQCTRCALGSHKTAPAESLDGRGSSLHATIGLRASDPVVPGTLSLILHFLFCYVLFCGCLDHSHRTVLLGTCSPHVPISAWVCPLHL